jgi:trehalose 6-phosphate synthase
VGKLRKACAALLDIAMEVKGRLLVVANRLPITIKQNDSGTYDFSMSSGGLVSGLKGLSKAVDFRWFGWPGIDVHRNDQAELRRQLNEQFGAVPVFIPKDLSEKHYDGFSSMSLLPNYHIT